MPKSSFADFFADWNYLIGAAVANAADLPEAERLRVALQQKVEAVDAEKLAQLAAQAEGRVRTQALNRLRQEAEDLAKRLRSMVVASVGPRNARLSQFGVAPLPERGRRRKPAEVPPPKEGPETAPPPAGPPAPQPTTSNN
jgi:hypothetical protein